MAPASRVRPGRSAPRRIDRRLAAALASGCALLWSSAAAPAQRVQVIVNGARVQGAIATPGPQDPDSGPEVDMFESPNLDRFLRRARQFLADAKYREAIVVLQAVVEGRTLEALAPGLEPDGAGAPPADPGDPNSASPEAALADPSQAVFSADGRIYRPARRLCHEYLAGMPPEGLALYQSMFEGAARDLLDQARRSGFTTELQRVIDRYFPTLAAGTAMQVLADRLMHEGRYRGAVQLLRDLADLYPAANLAELGIKPLWCRFKIALCLRLAGEVDAALEAASAMATEYPDESLRVMGELHSVAALPQSSLFAAGADGQVALLPTARSAASSWVDGATDALVPLWQFRFRGGDPYAPVPPSNRSGGTFVLGESVQSNAAPPAGKYGTGAQVAFFGDDDMPRRAVFLENFRLRVTDAFTGLLRLEGDGDTDPPPPREMRARARVPAYDLTLQTPVEDDERYYAVLGYNKTSSGLEALKQNDIVAYDKATCARVWTSAEFHNGDDGLEDVTFLAAPTVFGERLLVPTMRRDRFELQCLDRGTGRPLWHTRIHSGGTTLFKPPGTPVLVVGSLAYMLTNAGALAAVDAFAGDLRWIRKYERDDPLRPKPVTRRALGSSLFPTAIQFVEQDLPGFLPSRMFEAGGAVVFAACDSDMLMSVDGLTGEPVWMVDGTTRYAPYGRMRYLIGCNAEHLFIASEADAQTQVVCVDQLSGLVRWARPVPIGVDALVRWPGRGCVLDDWVLMPGMREVLALPADGGGDWRRLRLPEFEVGDDPLRGSSNLFSRGPWLGVCYSQGIEVYSTGGALKALAATTEDPLQRSELLVQAGASDEALEVLLGRMDRAVADDPQREGIAIAAVALARELALRTGKPAWLDRVEPYVTPRQARLRWYLARLDLFSATQQLQQYGQEQQRLYAYMEGKDPR